MTDPLTECRYSHPNRHFLARQVQLACSPFSRVGSVCRCRIRLSFQAKNGSPIRRDQCWPRILRLHQITPAGLSFPHRLGYSNALLPPEAPTGSFTPRWTRLSNTERRESQQTWTGEAAKTDRQNGAPYHQHHDKSQRSSD